MELKGDWYAKGREGKGTVEKLLAEKWMEGERKQSPAGQGDKSEFHPKTNLCLLLRKKIKTKDE